MRILALLLTLLCLLPGHAPAGAWPRAQGTWFVASDMRLSWPQDLTRWTSTLPVAQYYTVYAEYGLSRHMTLGLDLGRSVSGGGKSVLFLRMPLPDLPRHTKLAVDLGLGQIDGRAVLRPGLSLGQSVALFGLQGRLAADGAAELPPLR
ncbi:MAG: hypothetical protein ACKVKF_24655, partial [Rhodobacterales bacterium]